MGVSTVLLALIAAWAVAGPLPQDQQKPPELRCEPRLTALFAPRQPVLGRYEACTEPRTPFEMGMGAAVESLEPLAAFGVGGTYDRSALVRLYGGTRAQVVRRWTQTVEGFQSETLISPYPDPTLTRLLPGTLVIRWTCRVQDDGCGPPSGRH